MKKLSIVLATVLAFASVSAFANHKEGHKKGKKAAHETEMTKEAATPAPAAEMPKTEEHKAE